MNVAGQKHKGSFLIMVLLAFALLVPGSAAAATKELKIGALVALKSPEGVEMQRWFSLLEKMYNERGGW